MPIVYLGIGSNLGKRKDNCDAALRRLSENNIHILERSSAFETEPWGVKDQPKFINMTVKIETLLSPEDLLKLLKKIEHDGGRIDGPRWGPRVIDLDILLYDHLIMKTDELEIPHPGISDREFVLIPLTEIAPGLIHPVLKKSMKELLQELKK